jgi:hypothetical protein
MTDEEWRDVVYDRNRQEELRQREPRWLRDLMAEGEN